ncbi:hypothetical protein CSAL01_00399 [Colletotrichum salicis]|uniref:Uncharacterized protein n=1 Tax=Colletotrichum salicis TaxID=1209931 RepID=A0A135SFZ1_9PEZI|nr:hypothetical protein CSAL01_00399 [Colletotrichum salicis]
MKNKASDMDPEACAFRPSFIPHPPAPVPSTNVKEASRRVKESTRHCRYSPGSLPVLPPCPSGAPDGAPPAHLTTKHHSHDAPTATRVVRENTEQKHRVKGAAERPWAPWTKQATEKAMNPYWQPRDNARIAKRMKSDPKRNTEWLYISALKHVDTVSNHLI